VEGFESLSLLNKPNLIPNGICLNSCGQGGIRTPEDRSRLIYSQVRLTTPPPTHLKFKISVSRCPDLNRRPTPYHGVALPAELQRHELFCQNFFDLPDIHSRLPIDRTQLQNLLETFQRIIQVVVFDVIVS
jgi:hypothetical protein